MSANERASIAAELSPGHTIVEPRRQVAPLVLCSPHSGRTYPQRFLDQSKLTPLNLRRSEDCFVDDLAMPMAELGLPMIAAKFPRAYLDVNREPYELDPELFAEQLPDFANAQSVRVAGGLGTIARIVADGEEIYPEALPLCEAMARIDSLYKPFHQSLAGLLSKTYAKFGTSILIDCHSMPSTSMAASYGKRPDIVLGDRFGAACNPKLSGFIRQELTDLGYDVQMNRPYAGGYITEHYGRPARHQHAIQIEINRGLYLNEARFKVTDGFARLQTDLTTMATRLIATLPGLLDRRAAAE